MRPEAEHALVNSKINLSEHRLQSYFSAYSLQTAACALPASNQPPAQRLLRRARWIVDGHSCFWWVLAWHWPADERTRNPMRLLEILAVNGA